MGRLGRLYNAELTNGGGKMTAQQMRVVLLAFHAGEDATSVRRIGDDALFLELCAAVGTDMTDCAEREKAASVLGKSVRNRFAVIEEGNQRVETARVSGVLPALPCSEQGSSGWYATDDG